MAKKDITGNEDIQLLVNTFYDKVQNDSTIGFLFTDIAQVNWDQHLPVMYRFWQTVLLGEGSYKGNPMIKHIALNLKFSLTATHFNQWIFLWRQTVDELFEGEQAESVKAKGEQIKTLMLSKINGGQPISFLRK